MNPVTVTQPVRARARLSHPLAVLLSVAALQVKLRLGGLFDHSPFLLSLIAISISTFVGGLGPGIVAAITSGLLATYCLIPPVDSFALVWPQDWIGMGAFTLVSAVVILLINSVLQAYAIRQESGARRDPGVAFLAKPFTVDQLARKVAEALAGPARVISPSPSAREDR